MRRELDSCRYGVYWLLILKDQPVVGGLGLICPVAASGHNYLALVRQGSLNLLTALASRGRQLLQYCSLLKEAGTEPSMATLRLQIVLVVKSFCNCLSNISYCY